MDNDETEPGGCLKLLILALVAYIIFCVVRHGCKSSHGEVRIHFESSNKIHSH